MSTTNLQTLSEEDFTPIPQILSTHQDASEFQTKAEWLREKIQESIKDVSQKRSRNQRRASFIKLVMIIFSSAATIILGLQLSGSRPLFNDIAFVLTSIVMFLTAIEPFFNYRALWVEHEQAKWKFHRLKDELEFYTSGTKPENIDSEKIEDFHMRYQEIWNRLSISWIEHRQSNRFNI